MAFVTGTGIAQNNIDSFLNTLHNKDVKSVLMWVAPPKLFDSATGAIYIHTFEQIVTSIDESQIRLKYPKYLMVQKLVQLLDDPERDWYADLLLYNLTTKEFIGCDSRESWLTSIKHNTNLTFRQIDMNKWRKYLSALSPTDKW